MQTTIYSDFSDTTSWSGVQFAGGAEFESFLAKEVGPRLHDDAGKADFAAHLSSLASTGFAQDSLQAILEAEQPEERDWAAGEAMAEAWLSREHGVTWPWNMERDKRTPLASLPGADLIGFVNDGSQIRLALGEVKCSSDADTPPNVMTGRQGMTQQLENLVTDIRLMHTLIRWLEARCRGNGAESDFNAAIGLLLQSGLKAISFFGVLVRDTSPDEKDLQSRGKHLGNLITTPASCKLLALYLPCSIADLPNRMQGGAS